MKNKYMLPKWAVSRPKSITQKIADFLTAPLRMILFPDEFSEKLHLTSLRAERFAVVLQELSGAVLDVGAGDNLLLKTYINSKNLVDHDYELANKSVGVDVVDWGGDSLIVDSSDKLPFDDNSFDTIVFVACINHIPERKKAIQESMRVLKPGGKIIITMINRVIGEIGHKLWWYSEDKHREVDEDELMGMDKNEVEKLLFDAGIKNIETSRFFYGLNYIYVAIPDY